MKRPLILAAAALLVGCAAVPPPLAPSSPASAAAPEGARIPRLTSLRRDDATRQTAALQAEAQKEQDRSTADAPEAR